MKADKTRDPVLHRLGTLRIFLCVTALLLCCGIVISAVNLAPRQGQAAETLPASEPLPPEEGGAEVPEESLLPQQETNANGPQPVSDVQSDGASADPAPVNEADGQTPIPDGSGNPDARENSKNNPPADQNDGNQNSNNGGQNADGGNQTPDDGNQTPGDGSQTPDNGNQTPDNGNQTPDNGNQAPGDGSQTPGDGGQTPGDGNQTPGDGNQTPGDGNQTPGNDNQNPSGGGHGSNSTPGNTHTPQPTTAPAPTDSPDLGVQGSLSGEGTLNPGLQSSGDGFSADGTQDAPAPEAEPDAGQQGSSWALPAMITCMVLLAADIVGILLCTQAIDRRKQALREARVGHRTVQRRVQDTARTAAVAGGTAPRASRTPAGATGGISVGNLQNIGGRPYQEDSSGVCALSDGVLAVVADGMGGLSGGDKVSQKIVYTMLDYSKSLQPGQMDGVLARMVKGVTDTVNRMLGPDGLYKSGSTLLAVMIRQKRLNWITVGDSHICLYRNGRLIQLNQEHNRGQELLRKAIAGELSFEEVRADPKKSGLTSFVGMGTLKYVEQSLCSIPLKSGDRVVLMTDGVFNALSDSEIAVVLAQNPDVTAAARMMEQGVLAKAAPHQDNFTAVILGVD